MFMSISVHYANGGRPAFSLHFCINARNINCRRDNSRTCCKMKNKITDYVNFMIINTHYIHSVVVQDFVSG